MNYIRKISVHVVVHIEIHNIKRLATYHTEKTTIYYRRGISEGSRVTNKKSFSKKEIIEKYFNKKAQENGSSRIIF